MALTPFKGSNQANTSAQKSDLNADNLAVHGTAANVQVSRDFATGIQGAAKQIGDSFTSTMKEGMKQAGAMDRLDKTLASQSEEKEYERAEKLRKESKTEDELKQAQWYNSTQEIMNDEKLSGAQKGEAINQISINMGMKGKDMSNAPTYSLKNTPTVYNSNMKKRDTFDSRRGTHLANGFSSTLDTLGHPNMSADQKKEAYNNGGRYTGRDGYIVDIFKGDEEDRGNFIKQVTEESKYADSVSAFNKRLEERENDALINEKNKILVQNAKGQSTGGTAQAKKEVKLLDAERKEFLKGRVKTDADIKQDINDLETQGSGVIINATGRKTDQTGIPSATNNPTASISRNNEGAGQEYQDTLETQIKNKIEAGSTPEQASTQVGEIQNNANRNMNRSITQATNDTSKGKAPLTIQAVQAKLVDNQIIGDSKDPRVINGKVKLNKYYENILKLEPGVSTDSVSLRGIPEELHDEVRLVGQQLRHLDATKDMKGGLNHEFANRYRNTTKELTRQYKNESELANNELWLDQQEVKKQEKTNVGSKGSAHNGLKITSGYGDRKVLTGPRRGQKEFNNGPDYITKDMNANAVASGKVIAVMDNHENGVSTSNKSLGNYVIVEMEDGSSYMIAHLDKGSPVKVGQTISKGDIIGTAKESSGSGTGPHMKIYHNKGTNYEGHSTSWDLTDATPLLTGAVNPSSSTDAKARRNQQKLDKLSGNTKKDKAPSAILKDAPPEKIQEYNQIGKDYNETIQEAMDNGDVDLAKELQKQRNDELKEYLTDYESNNNKVEKVESKEEKKADVADKKKSFSDKVKMRREVREERRQEIAEDRELTTLELREIKSNAEVSEVASRVIDFVKVAFKKSSEALITMEDLSEIRPLVKQLEDDTLSKSDKQKIVDKLDKYRAKYDKKAKGLKPIPKKKNSLINKARKSKNS